MVCFEECFIGFGLVSNIPFLGLFFQRLYGISFDKNDPMRILEYEPQEVQVWWPQKYAPYFMYILTYLIEICMVTFLNRDQYKLLDNFSVGNSCRPNPMPVPAVAAHKNLWVASGDGDLNRVKVSQHTTYRYRSLNHCLWCSFLWENRASPFF